MALDTVVTLGEHQIATIVTGDSWRQNCYLLTHVPSGDQVVIDPGDSPDAIVQAVLDGGAQLRHVLLTHGHHDHVGAVAALCRRFDLPCEVHVADSRLLMHAPMYATVFAGRKIEAPERFRTYENQPVFQLGGQSIAVINTPGHTPGSVCYHLDGCVFTGDTLLYRQVGRTDLPGGDAVTLTGSVSMLVESLPGDTVVLPGHGRSWSVAEARIWWQEEHGGQK